MGARFSNNATSRLAVSITNADTALSISAGEGTKFPTLLPGDWFPITAINAAGQYEIMRVTAREDDTFTVLRGQEGTSPKAFSAGDRVELRVTAQSLEDRFSEKFDKTGGDVSGTIRVSAGTGFISERPDSSTDLLTVLAIRDENGVPLWDVSLSKTDGNHLEFIRYDSNADPAGSVLTLDLSTGKVKGSFQGSFEVDGASANLPWSSAIIGQPIPIFDHIDGVPVPPTDNPNFRFIKLTAADEYNNGVLTSETVSGSAPNITATAVINLPGSPLHGRTVRLINTERRFLRPGSAGVLEESQNITHSHTGTTSWNGDHFHGNLPEAGFDVNGAGGVGIMRVDMGDNSPFDGHIRSMTAGGHNHTFTTSASGGNETRPRNMGVTYYLRIL